MCFCDDFVKHRKIFESTLASIAQSRYSRFKMLCASWWQLPWCVPAVQQILPVLCVQPQNRPLGWVGGGDFKKLRIVLQNTYHCPMLKDGVRSPAKLFEACDCPYHCQGNFYVTWCVFFFIIIIYALRWVNMFRMSKRIAVYLGFCSDQGGGELHVLVCALKEWNQDFHLGLSKRTRFTLVEQLMSRLTNSLQFRRYVSVNLFMPAVLTQLAQCQRLWRDNCTGSTGWMGNRSSLARVIKKMHSSAALWNLSSSNRKASTPLDKLVLLLSFSKVSLFRREVLSLFFMLHVKFLNSTGFTNQHCYIVLFISKECAWIQAIFCA